MITACIVSGTTGAFLGVCFMALFIAGATEDKFIKEEIKKGQ